MKCQNESGCEGLLDETQIVPLRVGCAGFAQSFVCAVCGRLHWSSGKPVSNRQGLRAFLERDELVNRNADGAEIGRAPVGT